VAESPDSSEIRLPDDDSSIDDTASQFATVEQSSGADDLSAALDFQVPKQVGHYKIDALLGAGGMGFVFKGYDSNLKRYAALKILHAATPQLNRRFAQEARLQAKIDHPNVCKVYEVGEVDGKHFIAMQFIQGKTLRKAAKDLNIEQKIRIIKQVAGALHAAHKEGLVHRDMKPTNIMVVKTEEGTLEPYILDFGLAREQESAGLTQTGLVVGTPHYMAPEQARGNTNSVDRRTDVYSLGATLYELLSGRTPYSGKSSAEVLLALLQEDPLPLRKIDSNIPVDLETIVSKCMHKEPHLRYASAKELFEDLQRYLDGDPITARPIRFSERIIKKAKKNKVATAILAGALLTTIILVSTLIYLQTKSSFQSRYAREFGEEVRSIESMMNSVYSSPLHDIRGELEIVRKRLTKLEHRTSEAGSWAYGPGHNALGLGYFAIGDYDKAFQNLEGAWNSNYREPSTIYTLGKLYGIRYQRALNETSAIKNKAYRDEQIAKIEKELRDPAITYLKMSKASIDSPSYAEGLIAFYGKRYSDALKYAIEAYKQAGWSYDAKKLEGDLYLSSAKDLDDIGDTEKAAKNLEAAGAAYRTAIELGRSRAEIYVSEADRWTSILDADSTKGITNKKAMDQALHYSDQAIQINPDAPEGYARKMQVYTTAGSYLMYNTGDDPRPMMQHAIQMGTKLQKLSPKDHKAFSQPAIAYRINGEYEIRHGMDPRSSLTKAIEMFGKSLQLKPADAPNLGALGIVYSIRGEYEWKHGIDPRPSFEKAIEQYRTAERINPKYTPSYTNAGVAYWYIASYESSTGLNSSSAYKEAIKQYEVAIKSNPNNAFALFNQSLAYMDAGKFELFAGRDPSSLYAQSLEGFKKAEKLMNNSYLHSGLASIYYYMADYDFQKGKAPTAFLDLSNESCQKSIEIDPSYYEPRGFLGRNGTLAARWAMKAGESPTPYFLAAKKGLGRAIELNKEEGQLYQLSAELHRWEAEWLNSQKRSASESISVGLEMTKKTLAIDSTSADAYAVEGALYLLKAENEKDHDARLNLITKGKASLTHALKLNRWLEREYGPVLKKADQM
jgi:serine/threonine-protein kinase